MQELPCKMLQKDIHQLSDLTSSLILLTKFDRENIQQIFKEERIDEIIFDAYEVVLKPILNYIWTLILMRMKSQR